MEPIIPELIDRIFNETARLCNMSGNLLAKFADEQKIPVNADFIAATSHAVLEQLNAQMNPTEMFLTLALTLRNYITRLSQEAAAEEQATKTTEVH